MAEETKELDDVKAAMKADIEAEDGEDETKTENRYQKLANERNELKQSVANLQDSIETIKATHQEALDKEQLKEGNFSGVLQSKDDTIEKLKAQVEAERLKNSTATHRPGV